MKNLEGAEQCRGIHTARQQEELQPKMLQVRLPCVYDPNLFAHEHESLVLHLAEFDSNARGP